MSLSIPIGCLLDDPSALSYLQYTHYFSIIFIVILSFKFIKTIMSNQGATCIAKLEKRKIREELTCVRPLVSGAEKINRNLKRTKRLESLQLVPPVN